MSEAHTKGPWGVVPRDAPKGTLMVESIDGLIACMESSRTRPVTYEVAEANARLIAAAPDLLDGAKEFAAYESAMADGDDIAAMIHYANASRMLAAAIAKAQPAAEGV